LAIYSEKNYKQLADWSTETETFFNSNKEGLRKEDCRLFVMRWKTRFRSNCKLVHICWKATLRKKWGL